MTAQGTACRALAWEFHARLTLAGGGHTGRPTHATVAAVQAHAARLLNELSPEETPLFTESISRLDLATNPTRECGGLISRATSVSNRRLFKKLDL